jgi:trimeric autotransporter adhesin
MLHPFRKGREKVIRTIEEPAGRGISVFGLFVAALLFASLLLAAKSAHAATFTVNSTGDIGDATPDGVCDSSPVPSVTLCTLREAIQEANAAPGADDIRFSILGGGVKTISPASPLPRITDTVTIDGYTQPGASPNTLQKGNDAVLLIELNGENAGSGQEANGLIILARDCVLRGLVVNRFERSGIAITGPSASTTGNRIEGNFIGTDPSGTQDLGNGDNGVIVNIGGNIVGGASPQQRNVICGNGGEGVVLGTLTTSRVEGNYVGTAKDGVTALANDGEGVSIEGSTGSTVGGGVAGASNTIAFNGGNGVSLTPGPLPVSRVPTGNRIARNSIFSNGGLGIDLDDDGPTANDDGDADVGPNNLQNFPVITSARTSRTATTINGTLNSSPSSTFAIRFFSNPEGTDEGKTFIGQRRITTGAGGDTTFSFKPKKKVRAGQAITATATSASGDTSEFSAPKKVRSR